MSLVFTLSSIFAFFFGFGIQSHHYSHASRRWEDQVAGVSLERPHDNIHVAVGYPMSVCLCKNPIFRKQPIFFVCLES